MTAISTPSDRKPHAPSTIVATAAMALALAMGIGRFAFTSILPVMIADHALDLRLGSTLASINYLGYLLGAMVCMVIPARWNSARLMRIGLIGMVISTGAMMLPDWRIWLVLRFTAGMISAVTMVHTARWCFLSLAHLRRPELGSAMFMGVGLGIGVSGLLAMAMSGLRFDWQSNWGVYAVMGLLLLVLIWRVADPEQEAHRTTILARSAQTTPSGSGTSPEKTRTTLFALAYGLSGFGYIITATYLPLIARVVMPASALVDFFWPLYGLAAAIGSILATRIHGRLPARIILIGCYIVQGTGVMLTTFRPDVLGFFVGSLMAGLPFTAINFFAMDEAQRLRPNKVAQLIGLLTAAYAIGQILGPPTVEIVLHHVPDLHQGFDLSLRIAGGALLIGSFIYILLEGKRFWQALPIGAKA